MHLMMRVRKAGTRVRPVCVQLVIEGRGLEMREKRLSEAAYDFGDGSMKFLFWPIERAKKAPILMRVFAIAIVPLWFACVGVPLIFCVLGPSLVVGTVLEMWESMQ